jgi:transposase
MRGRDEQQRQLISYVNLEERVPADHPLRKIRGLVDGVLGAMNEQFRDLYARRGRPSIPPERLLRALLLQIFYSVRSERMLMEQLEYNLLFRWFVGLEIDEPIWNHAVFSKNRSRLLNEEVAQDFFARVTQLAEGFMSDEHFTVDGTLIEAWAGQKSFQRKDGEGPKDGSNFHGEKRRNDTHASTTDPEARLYKKSQGQEAKLSYLGHIVIENRNGLIREVMATQADGQAETDAALLMAAKLAQTGKRVTLGADKACDRKDFVQTVRELGVTPHVAQNNKTRKSAIDGRTTRHDGYRMSLSKRWLVEKAFGWMKQTGGLKKVKLRGLDKVGWLVTYTAAAYNLLRLKTLQEQCA